jgi:uncharacterized membrane protein
VSLSSVQLATLTAAFVASAVEFVEAVTIVLAVGTTRQWRSTLIGTGAAILALAVLVGLFGTAIAVLVPIGVLRLVVGGFLVIYGLQWLTKAILRAGGAKAKHDEAAIYEREIATLHAEPPIATTGMDWISFTVAFKGVLLEGLEVAFIVVTFGASAGMLAPAAIGAGAAGAVVLVVAALVRGPLTAVPENAMKFAVGLLLVTFGSFWAGEGVGVEWPAEDGAIVVLLVGYVVVSLAAVALLRRAAAGTPRSRAADGAQEGAGAS